MFEKITFSWQGTQKKIQVHEKGQVLYSTLAFEKVCNLYDEGANLFDL